MADYRRKRKYAGRQYNSGRRTSNYRRRPYTPKLSRLGGGGAYRGSGGYHRNQEFRYEREPELKPPKVETHYTIERPIESYRFPTYRAELDQTAVERIVGQTVDMYRRDNREGERLETNDQTKSHTETETPAEVGRNVEQNVVEEKPLEDIGLATSQLSAPQIELGSSLQPEPLSETLHEANSMQQPESFESYELPIADLELLLIELDANPLEAQPEKIVEPEGAAEQQ